MCCSRIGCRNFRSVVSSFDGSSWACLICHPGTAESNPRIQQLKVGTSIPQSGIKPKPWQWDHWILTTGPQGQWACSRTLVLVIFEERIKQSSEDDGVFIRYLVQVQEHMGRLRVSCTLKGQFKSPIRRQSSKFPLISLVSLFVLTQGPPQCLCASFHQNGFQHEGFWEVGTPSLLWPLSIFSAHVWSGRS